MNRVLKHILLACLSLVTGCNSVVFVEDADRLEVSVDHYEFPDTGDTLHLALNMDNWHIHDMLYTHSGGSDYIGSVKENGFTGRRRMQMKGLGEISIDNAMSGFKVLREKYDSLTVIMNPNFSFQECSLQMFLATEFQILELTFTQKPSGGYFIDRIEWDDELSTGSYVVRESNPLAVRREISMNGVVDMGAKSIRISDFMNILDTDHIDLPIPDPYPVDGLLTFSGDTLKWIPDVISYELDMETKSGRSNAGLSGTYVTYITYFTHFRIYVRHKDDDEVSFYASSGFYSVSPDFR